MVARDLSEADVHGGLAVGAEAAGPDPASPFGLPVLERLSDLIGVDHAAAYIEYDLNTQAWDSSSLEYPVVVYPPVDAAVSHFNPLCEESVGSSETPLTLSDFLTPRA